MNSSVDADSEYRVYIGGKLHTLNPLQGYKQARKLLSESVLVCDLSATQLIKTFS